MDLLGPVVEPNEEVQVNFAGPLSDELKTHVYILVTVDKWSKVPKAKIVTNTTARLVMKNYAMKHIK